MFNNLNECVQKFMIKLYDNIYLEKSKLTSKESIIFEELKNRGMCIEYSDLILKNLDSDLNGRIYLSNEALLEVQEFLAKSYEDYSNYKPLDLLNEIYIKKGIYSFLLDRNFLDEGFEKNKFSLEGRRVKLKGSTWLEYFKKNNEYLMNSLEESILTENEKMSYLLFIQNNFHEIEKIESIENLKLNYIELLRVLNVDGLEFYQECTSESVRVN